MPDGRILIAPGDGPLVASPTWVRIDNYRDNFVQSIDIERGRSDPRNQTDTGTMHVTFNDNDGVFDPSTSGSTGFGTIDGTQILCQLWDPTIGLWESQFRGIIDNVNYTPSPVATLPPTGTYGHSSAPIFANVEFECVDIFDYLNSLEMVPGRFGDTPPAGAENLILYEDTAGTVDDRIIQALTDAGIDSTMYVVFTGNVSVQESRFSPGDNVLQVLRQAADAELPMIANIYVDRQGMFVFHGRESRFDPDTVSAAAGGSWNFTRWGVADAYGASTYPGNYAQMRAISYSRGRRDVVNAALAWPQGMPQNEIPDNIAVDATSITDYGYHPLPPLENLIVKAGTTTGNTAKQECAAYAQLYVANLKTPANRINTLTVKSIDPDDARAVKTWPIMSQADISDIINVWSEYPGGDGIAQLDYYIEGMSKRIRPGGPDYDYVEVDFNVSPAEWSMDLTGVFS